MWLALDRDAKTMNQTKLNIQNWVSVNSLNYSQGFTAHSKIDEDLPQRRCIAQAFRLTSEWNVCNNKSWQLFQSFRMNFMTIACHLTEIIQNSCQNYFRNFIFGLLWSFTVLHTPAVSGWIAVRDIWANFLRSQRFLAKWQTFRLKFTFHCQFNSEHGLSISALYEAISLVFLFVVISLIRKKKNREKCES